MRKEREKMYGEKIINETFDEAITEVWNDDDYYDIGYNSGLEEGRRIALALLKEQEPIKPKLHYIDRYGKHFIDGFECGACGCTIGEHSKYCYSL